MGGKLNQLWQVSRDTLRRRALPSPLAWEREHRFSELRQLGIVIGFDGAGEEAEPFTTAASALLAARLGQPVRLQGEPASLELLTHLLDDVELFDPRYRTPQDAAGRRRLSPEIAEVLRRISIEELSHAVPFPTGPG